MRNGYIDNKTRSNISLILSCADPKNLDEVAEEEIAAEIVLSKENIDLIDYALVDSEILTTLCLAIKESNESKQKEKIYELFEIMKKCLVKECKNEIEGAIEYKENEDNFNNTFGE